MNIAFCGDSFVADYRLSDKLKPGWPVLLNEALKSKTHYYGIAGACQYRILNQFKSTILDKNLELIIMSHTSPFRIYTNHHPLRSHDPLHFNSDFVISDTFSPKKYNKDNHVVAAQMYFKYLLDEDHCLEIHRLICEKIETLTKNINLKIIHLSGFDYSDIYRFDNWIDIEDIVRQYPGNINHLSPDGNQKILDRILNILK